MTDTSGTKHLTNDVYSAAGVKAKGLTLACVVKRISQVIRINMRGNVLLRHAIIFYTRITAEIK